MFTDPGGPGRRGGICKLGGASSCFKVLTPLQPPFPALSNRAVWPAVPCSRSGSSQGQEEGAVIPSTAIT